MLGRYSQSVLDCMLLTVICKFFAKSPSSLRYQNLGQRLSLFPLLYTQAGTSITLLSSPPNLYNTHTHTHTHRATFLTLLVSAGLSEAHSGIVTLLGLHCFLPHCSQFGTPQWLDLWLCFLETLEASLNNPQNEDRGFSLCMWWCTLTGVLDRWWMLSNRYGFPVALTLQNPLVTMYRQFNIQHSEHTFCPHSVLYVWCGSEKKQRLFPYTALNDWFL